MKINTKNSKAFYVAFFCVSFILLLFFPCSLRCMEEEMWFGDGIKLKPLPKKPNRDALFRKKCVEMEHGGLQKLCLQAVINKKLAEMDALSEDNAVDYFAERLNRAARQQEDSGLEVINRFSETDVLDALPSRLAQYCDLDTTNRLFKRTSRMLQGANPRTKLLIAYLLDRYSVDENVIDSLSLFKKASSIPLKIAVPFMAEESLTEKKSLWVQFFSYKNDCRGSDDFHEKLSCVLDDLYPLFEKRSGEELKQMRKASGYFCHDAVLYLFGVAQRLIRCEELKVPCRIFPKHSIPYDALEELDRRFLFDVFFLHAMYIDRDTNSLRKKFDLSFRYLHNYETCMDKVLVCRVLAEVFGLGILQDGFFKSLSLLFHTSEEQVFKDNVKSALEGLVND